MQKMSAFGQIMRGIFVIFCRPSVGTVLRGIPPPGRRTLFRRSGPSVEVFFEPKSSFVNPPTPSVGGQRFPVVGHWEGGGDTEAVDPRSRVKYIPANIHRTAGEIVQPCNELYQPGSPPPASPPPFPPFPQGGRASSAQPGSSSC